MREALCCTRCLVKRAKLCETCDHDGQIDRYAPPSTVAAASHLPPGLAKKSTRGGLATISEEVSDAASLSSTSTSASVASFEEELRRIKEEREEIEASIVQDRAMCVSRLCELTQPRRRCDCTHLHAASEQVRRVAC